MDRLTLSRIDEELDSSEVSALCFLCSDVVNRKGLEGIVDARGLFVKLEERGRLDNHLFLSELLHTIRRADLLSLLEADSRHFEETDASPILSHYRVMLYHIYEDLTQDHLDKMKFLLSHKLGRGQMESCNTALDVFAKMEKAGLLSNSNVAELHAVLLELDQPLAETVREYNAGITQQPQTTLPSHISMDYQRDNNTCRSTQASLSICDTQLSNVGHNVCLDAQSNTESPSPLDQQEYYALVHNPRGVCVIFNNEKFLGMELRNRTGTQQDEKTLRNVFALLGFTVVVKNNLTAEEMRLELKELGQRNFMDDDALVICVLSHGEKGCVFGSDENAVSLRELTRHFTSERARTLAGKPKLFFIQACQGSGYHRGSLPCPPKPRQEEQAWDRGSRLEVDAGTVYGETVPSEADFLLGMATVQEYKSFRSTSTGSIYIQALCKQLKRSAESSENDDILTVLTRVNREVGKGEYLSFKQMPEPKYTLTKKLVLKRV